MKDIASEDSIRRALASLDESEAIAWADKHLANSTRPVLSLAPWILDTDNTVKCLYAAYASLGWQTDNSRRTDDCDHHKHPCKSISNTDCNARVIKLFQRTCSHCGAVVSGREDQAYCLAGIQEITYFVATTTDPETTKRDWLKSYNCRF